MTEKHTNQIDRSEHEQYHKHSVIGCDFANPNEKDKTVIRMQSITTSQYRLVNRNGILTLQGLFNWTDGNCGGTEWIDIPTVYEESVQSERQTLNRPHRTLSLTEEDKKLLEPAK